jgi:pilus assembly protein CpaB
MRARNLILIATAILMAGATVLLARTWIAVQRQEVAAAASLTLPVPARSILVARSAMQRGQILRPENLVWQPWPDDILDKSYVLLGSRTPQSFAGWVARYPLAAGDPITDTKVVAPGHRGFLAAVLRPGMRAISVPITATSGISGFVSPGDHVDIMITHIIAPGAVANDIGGSTTQRQAAETVLHDVRVIGIDQRLESKASEAVVGHTATLEVTPKQAEFIELAAEMGKLSLLLRSLRPTDGAADQRQTEVSEVTSEPPTYTLENEVSQLRGKSVATPETATVTILRGSSKTGQPAAAPAASNGPAT